MTRTLGRRRPTWGFEEGDELLEGRSVLRRIGGGRRYETLLVWDEHRLAILVAKVLRPDALGELPALRREADLLARLAHPVLVRSFGACVDCRFPHLVLEHLEGPTLDALVARDGPLALEQLLPLGLHVAAALHYLHAEGVVHLDVKPSNIVMGSAAPADRPFGRVHGRRGRVAAGTGRHRGLHGARGEICRTVSPALPPTSTGWPRRCEPR